MDKIKQKIEEGWIHCVFIIEMLGKPKEHLEKTLKGYIIALKKDKKVKILKEEYAEPEKDKGCYVGQELTARMKYRALLKKRIYSLIAKVGSPKVDQTIKVDGDDYGKIISIENKSVLAMLKIDSAERIINLQYQIKTDEGLVFEFIV